VSDDTAQAAGEGMSKERTPSWYDDAPITDEQLDSVRRDLTLPVAERGAAFAPFVVRKLLAEVERLRNLEDSYIVALDQCSVGDLQRAVAERDEARARLAEIGETEVEWGVRGTLCIGLLDESTPEKAAEADQALEDARFKGIVLNELMLEEAGHGQDD